MRGNRILAAAALVLIAAPLDGLFLVLGQQEKEIRTNPSAQVTSLLKKVFGK